MNKDYLLQLVKLCPRYDGDAIDDELREAANRFLVHANDDPALLAEAAVYLPQLPPMGAAFLALAFGTAVENGGDAQASGPPLLALLHSWMQKLPQVPKPADDDEDDDFELPEPDANQQLLLDALPSLCQAVVAQLARLPALREKLAEDDVLLDRLNDLQGYSHGAMWVREALIKISGTLIVLDPVHSKGFELRFANVSNCFHLFSLVQSALGQRVAGGREPDSKVAAAAREGIDELVGDVAWWHYGDPRSPTAELAFSIWGEGSPRDIPLFDGKRVMLLWPPLLQSRGWDAGFFTPRLEAFPADVSIERALSDAESRDWLQRLGTRLQT